MSLWEQSSNMHRTLRMQRSFHTSTRPFGHTWQHPTVAALNVRDRTCAHHPCCRSLPYSPAPSPVYRPLNPSPHRPDPADHAHLQCATQSFSMRRWMKL